MAIDVFGLFGEDTDGIPPAADRPDDLRRALNFVVDFVGPGFTVERFESAQAQAYLASFCEPGVTPVVDLADPAHHASRHRPEIRGLKQAAASQG